MVKSMAELHALAQKTIESDTTFQSGLSSLSEEEKTAKIEERKQQEIDKYLSDAETARLKAEEIAKNQKIRAEKAEEDAKKSKPVESSGDNISTKDTLALIENKVSTEDFDEVIRVAKILGKSIPEALKDKTLKSILSERMEERQTAAATNTRGGSRGTAQVTPEAVLAEAERGNLPDDDAGISALAAARIGAKKKK